MDAVLLGHRFHAVRAALKWMAVCTWMCQQSHFTSQQHDTVVPFDFKCEMVPQGMRYLQRMIIIGDNKTIGDPVGNQGVHYLQNIRSELRACSQVSLPASPSLPSG